MRILLFLRLRKTITKRPWQLISFTILTSMYTLIALCACGVSAHIYRSMVYFSIPTSLREQQQFLYGDTPTPLPEHLNSSSHPGSSLSEINPRLSEMLPADASSQDIVYALNTLGQSYYLALLIAWTILGFILATLLFLRYRIQHHERIRFFAELNRYGYSPALAGRITAMELVFYSCSGFILGTSLFLAGKAQFKVFTLVLLPLDLSVPLPVYLVVLLFLLLIDLGYSFYLSRSIKRQSFARRKRATLLIDAIAVLFIEMAIFTAVASSSSADYRVIYVGGILVLLGFVIMDIFLVKFLLVMGAKIAIKLPWVSLNIAGKQTLHNLSWMLQGTSYAVISFYMIIMIIGLTNLEITAASEGREAIFLHMLLPDILFSTAGICFLTWAISTIVFIIYLLVYLQQQREIMREWLRMGWKLSTLVKIIFWQVLFGTLTYLLLVLILYLGQLEKGGPHAHLPSYLLFASIFTVVLQLISTLIISGVSLTRLYRSIYPLESSPTLVLALR